MSQSKLLEYGIADWRIIKENPAKYADFLVKNSIPLGCQGCFYSNLAAFLCGRPSLLFNRFVDDWERFNTDDFYYFECIANGVVYWLERFAYNISDKEKKVYQKARVSRWEK